MEQSPPEQIEKKPQITGTTITNSSSTTGLTVDQLDIEILPVIYDIIRCVEKDPIDNAPKQKESQECSQKILELQKRFESARNQIKQLPGIDYNKEEQLQQLELLKNQLKLKQQLIKKYKNYQLYLANNEQLVQRLSESYPVRRAAQLAISVFYKSKSIAQEYRVEELTPRRFKSFIETFKTNVKEGIEGAKEELKKRK